MFNPASNSMLRSAVLLLTAWAICATAHFKVDNAAEMLHFGRRHLLDEANTDLSEPIYAFLTKYEEAFNISAYTSNPKAAAVWGWSSAEKAVKYAIVAPAAASDALSSDITAMHLHLNAMRGMNSTDIFALMKNNGTNPEKDGYKVYSMGKIMDADVAAWTNTLGLKTAEALWKYVQTGRTYTNIHTTMHPDGECRGQNDWNYDDIETVEDFLSSDIRQNDDNWRLAFLTTYEQTMPTTGNRSARGFAIYGWDGARILYTVTSGPKATDNLDEVMDYSGIAAAHIHIGGMRGEDVGTIISLMPNGTGAWNTVKGLKVYCSGNISDMDVKVFNSNANNSKIAITSAKDLWMKIAAGDTYTNVHTKQNPNGEIRGQNDWSYKGVEVLKASVPAPSTTMKSGVASLKPWTMLVLATGLLMSLCA